MGSKRPPSAGQGGLDRGNRLVQQVGQFGDRHAVDVVRNEQAAMARRDPVQRGQHRLPQRAVGPILGETHEIGRPLAMEEGDGVAALGLSPAVDDLVPSHRHQPGRGDRLAPAVGAGDHGGVEDLAGDILALGRAQPGGGEPVHRRQHGPVQLLEARLDIGIERTLRCPPSVISHGRVALRPAH